MPILIHKGNFKVVDAHSTIYLISDYENENEYVEDMYSISRINSLQVEKVVDKVLFGK